MTGILYNRDDARFILKYGDVKYLKHTMPNNTEFDEWKDSIIMKCNDEPMHQILDHICQIWKQKITEFVNKCADEDLSESEAVFKCILETQWKENISLFCKLNFPNMA